MTRIKAERLRRNWSQFELAKRANITQADICKIEHGKIYVYPNWRKRLAKALGMSEIELFEGRKSVIDG
ncbi:helix-turn-helix transcriptional regulator [Neomoorella humiferrea]|uniref:helix-turn-helix domain-containing protein n=1 Tax=Neomoorella humiferrea TaxID=676965 RepID=UPI003D9373EF